MKLPSENKTKFLAVIGAIAFGGIWISNFKVSVFAYVDWWFVVGLIIILIAAWFINKRNDKSHDT